MCIIRLGLRTALSAAAAITAGALIIGGVVGMGGLVFGQTAVAPAGKAVTRKAWTPPRTPDGQPDLQGRYTRNGVGAGGTGQDGGAPWAEANPPEDPLDPGK